MRIPRSTATLALAATLFALATLETAAVRAQDENDEFSNNLSTVYRFFEGGGIELENWHQGPVSYIMLPHERDTWNDLESDEHRRQFIQWFWARRDTDSRDDEHPTRTELYTRVAYANGRFRGFPRGWRSDRGRVYIVLGPPTGGMRRENMDGYGRCSAREGERWVYFTNNMTFSSSMGEFWIFFVETRVGQYEICEPSMMGIGAWPVDVRRAMEITGESLIVDSATEFEAGRSAGSTSSTVEVRETVARTEPLEVPLAEWGAEGAAGSVLIPIELPLRDLLFEPGETTMAANLVVDARMVPLGDNEERSGRQEWVVELGPDAASTVGGGALRTAIVLPADEGGYSASVRVFEPLSGTAWTWEGPVEVRADGGAVSPPLVSRTLVRLRDNGEVGVLGRSTGRLEPGEPFSIVSWVRGHVPAAEDVTVTVFDAADNAVVLEDLQIAWGSEEFAGPLVIQATSPPAVPGDYILRLEVGGGLPYAETRVRIE